MIICKHSCPHFTTLRTKGWVTSSMWLKGRQTTIGAIKGVIKLPWIKAILPSTDSNHVLSLVYHFSLEATQFIHQVVAWIHLLVSFYTFRNTIQYRQLEIDCCSSLWLHFPPSLVDSATEVLCRYQLINILNIYYSEIFVCLLQFVTSLNVFPAFHSPVHPPPQLT